MNRGIKKSFNKLRNEIVKSLLSGNFFLEEYKNSVAKINCFGISLVYQIVDNDDSFYFELFLYGDIDLKLSSREGKDLISKIKEKALKIGNTD